MRVSYEVKIDPGALREFDKLPKAQQKRVAKVIDGFAINPRPPGAEKMTGVEAYKLRVGDYRIIYAVKDEVLVVLIVRLGNRREVYRDIIKIRKRLRK